MMRKKISVALCGLFLLSGLNAAPASAVDLTILPFALASWATGELVQATALPFATTFGTVAAADREIINAVKSDSADYIASNGANLSGNLAAALNALREKAEDSSESSEMQALAGMSDMEIVKSLYFESVQASR